MLPTASVEQGRSLSTVKLIDEASCFFLHLVSRSIASRGHAFQLDGELHKATELICSFSSEHLRPKRLSFGRSGNETLT
jgi:hypothetical protein